MALRTVIDSVPSSLRTRPTVTIEPGAYLPGKLGLRWRTRQEVMDGRGDRSCGNKHCRGTKGLVTLEVPFSYPEGGGVKKELVKLRLCATCRPLVNSKGSNKEQPPESDRAKSLKREVESGSESDSSSSDSSSSRKRKKKSKKHKKRRSHHRKKRRSSDR